jgi:hypothetical protein
MHVLRLPSDQTPQTKPNTRRGTQKKSVAFPSQRCLVGYIGFRTSSHISMRDMLQYYARQFVTIHQETHLQNKSAQRPRLRI